jgi:peptidoglycan/LPS O-acetylase OafA/YrhL
VSVLDQLPGRLDQFVFGMLAAHLLLHIRKSPQGGARLARWGDGALAAGCIAGLFLIYWLHRNVELFLSGHWSLYVWNSAFGAATALCIFGIAAGGRIARALFANPVSVWLGVVSYSVYLWHFPIVEWISRQSLVTGIPGPRWLPITLAALPLVLAVAALWYRFVERPFLVNAAREEDSLPRFVCYAREHVWKSAAIAAIGLTAWAALWFRH